MKIKFLGAAGTVTGSKYLLESNSGQRILIDCGLFQGLKQLRLRNWENFPIDPKSISALILTHAHLDHSGYIPKLVKEGFCNEIFCSSPTRAVAEILLEDSAKLKEEEAEYANRKNFSKHHPALALYTDEDVQKSLKLFRTRNLKEEFSIDDFKVKFYEAGHIIGAVSVLIEADNTSILFSGDLGRYHDLLLDPPAHPPVADYIVMESTYGNKLHTDINPIEAMKELISSTVEKESVLLIASFALGRAQTLLYTIYKVFEQYPNLKIPVYVNSPMAESITRISQQFISEHKLDKETLNKIYGIATFVADVNESKELNKKSGPMIIISASGMLTGGRILHHLQAFGNDSSNTIVLAGFQAAGTRGAALARGERSIKFFGYYHDIEADVKLFDFLSAHADQSELLSWLKSAVTKPKKVFLSHGEPEAADTLRRKIEEELNLPAKVAEDGEEVLLS